MTINGRCAQIQLKGAKRPYRIHWYIEFDETQGTEFLICWRFIGISCINIFCVSSLLGCQTGVAGFNRKAVCVQKYEGVCMYVYVFFHKLIS